jgi:hypothetical protein
MVVTMVVERDTVIARFSVFAPFGVDALNIRRGDAKSASDGLNSQRQRK